MKRRSVIKAAAWAAPVIAVAAAAPMAAASVIQPGLGSDTRAQILTGNSTANNSAWLGGGDSYIAVETDSSGGSTGILDVRFYPPTATDPDALAKWQFALADGTVLTNPGAGATAQVPGNSPWYYTFDQGSNGAWRLSLYYPEQSRADAGLLGPYYVPQVTVSPIDGAAVAPISSTNQVSYSRGSSDPELNGYLSQLSYWPI